ncbi:hypothetical protein B0H14DRAFT_617188 [Mycena olivaceomarginata]|nr:hypothetical protein B0H14DRAFT_617188 [Mycena olivaceomarginata]
MIGTIWSSMLIPLLVVLIVFSNPGMRGRPLFIMNLVSVLTGIRLGNLECVSGGHCYPFSTYSDPCIHFYLDLLFFSFTSPSSWTPSSFSVSSLFTRLARFPGLNGSSCSVPPILFKIHSSPQFNRLCGPLDEIRGSHYPTTSWASPMGSSALDQDRMVLPSV